ARRQRPADRVAALGEERVLDLLDRNHEGFEPLVALFGFYPDAPELFVEATRVLRRAGSADADAYRKEALIQAERHAHGRAVIASGDVLEGQIELAVQLLRDTVRLFPADPEPRLFLAELMQERRDADGCLAALVPPAGAGDPYHRARAWCY